MTRSLVRQVPPSFCNAVKMGLLIYGWSRRTANHTVVIRCRHAAQRLWIACAQLFRTVVLDDSSFCPDPWWCEWCTSEYPAEGMEWSRLFSWRCEDQYLAFQNSHSIGLLADDYFDGSEAEALLQEAIATLPDVQRTVFLLRYFEEKKYSEISQMLDTSEGALKASYHIAVKKISDYFKSHD